MILCFEVLINPFVSFKTEETLPESEPPPKLTQAWVELIYDNRFLKPNYNQFRIISDLCAVINTNGLKVELLNYSSDLKSNVCEELRLGQYYYPFNIIEMWHNW